MTGLWKEEIADIIERHEAEIKKLRDDLEFAIDLEREACAQVALCLGEDAGTAIAAGIRARRRK
jgi:hypothetical protein